jgi:hypothetical protein
LCIDGMIDRAGFIAAVCGFLDVKQNFVRN